MESAIPNKGYGIATEGVDLNMSNTQAISTE
jgi:hypothetical protein